MEIMSVVITVILLALLIFSIVKKRSILPTLFLLTLAGYACATAMKGTSFIENSTGSIWLDVFETFSNSLAGVLSSTGLIILVVMSYATYMSKIQAAEKFAAIVAKPLSKIRAKYALVAVITFVAFLFILIIPSGMSCFVVALGTLYPVLIAVGVNPLTAAVAVVLGANLFVGPANPFVLMCLENLGLNLSAADFFVGYSLPVVVIGVIAIGVVHAFWSRHLDKKEGTVEVSDVKRIDSSEIDVPWYYALLPVIPLVFIIVFSSISGVGIVISVAGAYTLCLVISFIVHFLTTRNGKAKAFDELTDYFKAMGEALSGPTLVVVMGTFFAGALAALGGIAFVIDVLANNLGLGFWPMLVVITLLYFIMSILAGPNLAIPICAPAMLACATITDSVALLPCAAVIMTFGGGLGLFLQPFDPKLLMISEICGVDIMTVIKRSSVPAVAGLIVCFIVSVIILA